MNEIYECLNIFAKINQGREILKKIHQYFSKINNSWPNLSMNILLIVIKYETMEKITNLKDEIKHKKSEENYGNEICYIFCENYLLNILEDNTIFLGKFSSSFIKFYKYLFENEKNYDTSKIKEIITTLLNDKIIISFAEIKEFFKNDFFKSLEILIDVNFLTNNNEINEEENIDYPKKYNYKKKSVKNNKILILKVIRINEENSLFKINQKFKYCCKRIMLNPEKTKSKIFQVLLGRKRVNDQSLNSNVFNFF